MKYLLLIVLLFAVGCSKKNTSIDLIPKEKIIIKEVEILKTDTVIIKEECPEKIIPVYEPVDEIIYFNFDSDELTKESIKTLNMIRNTISPNTELVITGGTCPIGEDIYNYRLGLRRAHEAYKYLESFIGSFVDMVVASVGEGDIVNSNPGEYYLNRRVVIKGMIK